MSITESKPSVDPGTYYGELSPDKQWFWSGTGTPDDIWIRNPDLSAPEVTPPEIAPRFTSSQLQYDWIELYLTPVTGP